VDKRIFEHSANREAVQAQSKLERISNNTAAIVSLLRRYQALSQVYAANGKLQATLGLEPRVDDLNAISLGELVPVVAKTMGNWNESLLQQQAAAPALAVAAIKAEAAVAPVSAAPASLAVEPVAATVAAPAQTAEPAAAIEAASADAPRRFFLGSFVLPSRGPSLNWKSEAAAAVAWADKAGEAEAIANGRLILGVPSDGKREAQVEWSITDVSGRPLGRASYSGQVSKPATNEEWRQLKQGALAALARAQYVQ